MLLPPVSETRVSFSNYAHLLTVLMVSLEVNRDEEELKNRLSQLPRPSEMARYFTQSSENLIFLNNRPAVAQGLPTELLHPVFGQFLDDCTTLLPTPDDVLFATKVSTSMAGYFKSEGDRTDCLLRLFREHLEIDIRGMSIGKAITDGTWQTGPRFEFMAMNIGVKNEIGSSGDPYIQNIGYYSLYVQKNQNAKTFGLPCILVSVAGMTNVDSFLWCFSS